jgi:hypothetical protein
MKKGFFSFSYQLDADDCSNTYIQQFPNKLSVLLSGLTYCHVCRRLIRPGVVFPRESHFVIPGKAGLQVLFPGTRNQARTICVASRGTNRSAIQYAFDQGVLRIGNVQKTTLFLNTKEDTMNRPLSGNPALYLLIPS